MARREECNIDISIKKRYADTGYEETIRKRITVWLYYLSIILK